MRARPLAQVAGALGLALAGCGGGGSSDRPASTGATTTATTSARTATAPRTATATARRPVAPERDERPASLPHGWTRVVDTADGFSFAVPRGWRAHRVQGGELVRSADRALAVSVSYDRGAPARTLDLRDYASRSAHALQGYRNLHARRAHRVPGQPHPTVTVEARGVFLKTHVRQNILVIAVRRPDRGRSRCWRSAAPEPEPSATRRC